MKYPVNCNKCTQALYGPVKYCPFCGTASPSITARAERPPIEGTTKPPEPTTTEETQPKSTALSLSATRVDFDGVDVGSGLKNKTVSYEKIGDHPLAGSISSDADFLTVTPSALSPGSGAIEVALDTNKVQPGQVYSQQIRIIYNGADNAISIPVEIRVNRRKPDKEDLAEIRVLTGAVNFVNIRVGRGITTQTASYEKVGDHPLAGSISTNADFLTVTPTSLSPDSGEIKINLDTSKLTWDTVYCDYVLITYNGTDSLVKIPVNIRVSQKPKPLAGYILLGLLLLIAIFVIVNTFPTRQETLQVLDRVVAIKDSNVNVRAGPSGSDTILGRINVRRGQSVELLDAKGDWYRIKINIAGKESGWVSKSFFLRRSDVDDALAAKGYGFLNVGSDASGGFLVTGTVKDKVDLVRVTEILSKFGRLVTLNITVEPRPEPPGPTPTLIKDILANRGYPNLDVSLLDDRFIVGGDVDTNQDIEKVGQIISSIPGIKNYENRVKVRETPPPPSPPAQSFTHSVRPQLWSIGLEQVQQMINYASNDGGVNRETEIADARRRIEGLAVRKELPAISRTAARAANMRGLDEQRKGRITEAFQAFREAYRADPGDVEVVNNLGYTYMRRGDESSSEQALMLALLLAPDRSGAWAILGYLYATQGKESAAVACFANTYRFSRDKGKTREFFNKVSETDGDPKVRAAARAALDLPLLRSQTPGPVVQPPDKLTSLNWVVYRMKTLLQSSGYSDITVKQTGPQEITLGGVVRSEEESIKVREIAGREGRGKAVVVKWDFQIKR